MKQEKERIGMNKWQTSNPPKGTWLLVRWGSKASGNMGITIGMFLKDVWRGEYDEKIENDGFIVTGWMHLPPLD